MASDGTRWSKDKINALIDAYSDAKMSADPMTTNRELYSSIKSLLELNNDVQRSTKQIETKVKKLKSGYSKLKDRTHPVEDPPDEHLMESSSKGESDETESSAVNEVESGAAEPNTESSAAQVNTTQTSKPPKRKSGKDGKPKKKPRLCDVVEQSNEQMKQMQDYMQSNSVTLEERSKEREKDREFFRQMLGMMSQTMMRMT
ncbi:hypothetical protein P5673_029653 [Acropora cervicornis]|uniref:Myb/SANT-like DNA-binding domain-containing protein n=1 Tax=Acropora cervicornis TaxID=6130 RepID=A0AAD9PVU6_ACRCE|nr:hypothetical protein P5673_029653 [Acropora cervicornis]